MSALLQRIAANQAQLEKHAFCQHLINRRDVSLHAYSFVPHMTFFILGFRDILEEIRIKNPKNALEVSLNEHCDEDSDHWLWFIEDLKTLDMDVDHWGGSISSVLQTLWASDTYIVRELVYRIISHIRAAQNAEEKMIIIDCMEATFSVFINSLNVITRKNGRYNKLKFFGKQHYEAEHSHASGNWLEGEKHHDDDDYADNIQNFRLRHMCNVIDDIFEGFDQMFRCWHSKLEAETASTLDIAV
jgi:hypothetical protein